MCNCMCTLAVLFPSFSSCTSPLVFFSRHNTASGDLWIQMSSTGTCIHDGLFISLHFYWTIHTLFFSPPQHCIGRSLDPNDYHWEMHSVRPFHFPTLLLDYTQCKFIFFQHNTASGDLWIQMTRCGTRIHLGFFISMRFFWTAHSPDFNE